MVGVPDRRAKSDFERSEMKTLVQFRSHDFPPYEGEEEDVNPGRYGKRLAVFLVRELKNKGFEPREPIAEDWGWVIAIKNDAFGLWIGCGNLDGEADAFLCFIEPHSPRIRRFPFLWTIDTSRRVGQLHTALDEILSGEPAIREKRWWTEAEFNAQRAASVTEGATCEPRASCDHQTSTRSCGSRYIASPGLRLNAS